MQDNSINSFPSDDINPDDKKKAPYALQWAKAAYNNYKKDQGGIINSKSKDISLLRLYAEGRQPVEKYMDILCPKDKHGKRKTFMDISQDPISVIPKFRSIVIGKFMQIEHEIEANAVDEASAGERRKKRFDLWADAQIQKQLAPFQDMLQVGINPEEASKVLPSSIEELNMLQEAGSFKLQWEAGIEKLIEDAMNLSNWQDIKQKMFEDIFDIGMIATRDFTNKASGKAEVRAVDLERLVVRYSKKKNYDNIDFAGEVLDVTPIQIRTEAGEDLPKNVIDQIIEQNKSVNKFDYSYTDNQDFYFQQGNTSVKVLDLTWKTIDTIKQEKRIDKRGEEHYNYVSFDYDKKPKQGKREILVGKRQMVYKCKWIIGTDYVYDYGVEEDIARPTPKTVKLPFNIYKLTDKSMLELIIPNEDNLNLAWLRFQNGIAKAAPPGIAVDISALKNVSNGKNKLTPLQVLQIRRETGDLLFSATTTHSQVINPNAGRPIFDLPGGVGGYLKEQMEIISFNIDMIRQLTGINEMMDATAPNPNTLVGTAEIAQQGTNNTLYNLFYAYKRVKEGSASNLSYRIQSIIRYGDYMPYIPVIGTSLLKMFQQGSPIAEASFGITLRLKPQQAEKARMLQKADIAFQQQIITFSDYMFLEQEIENGSLKYARIFISYKESEHKKQAMLESQQNVQAQSQAIMEQQENAKAGRMEEDDNKSKNKQQEIIVKAKADSVEYQQRGEIKKEEEDNKAKNKVIENLSK